MIIVVIAAVLLSLMAGYRFDAVRSGSMSPEIEVGDLLISGPVDPKKIEVGDVILYRSQGAIVCHRVIAVDHDAEYVNTKGDANEGPDPYKVSYSSIVGKTIANVTFLGYVTSFLSSVYGLATIAVAGVVIYLYGGMTRKDDATKDKEE